MIAMRLAPTLAAVVRVGVALAGCAGNPPPERAYYLLRAEVPVSLAAPDPDRLFGMAHEPIAPYLARTGIVVQVEANRVREARYHLWAEPLTFGIRAYLHNRVSAELGRPLGGGPGTEGTWRYRVDVTVEVFHGTLGGEARLVALWAVRDLVEERVIEAGRFSRSQRQTADGYAGLVQAQIALLDELAREVARPLREILGSA